MAESLGSGGKLYVTTWEDGSLYILTIDTDNITINNQSEICEATMTQLEDREYYTFPIAVWGDDDQFYLAGRMSSLPS
jgi:hypothetical protein